MTIPTQRQSWTQTNNKNQRAMEAAQIILQQLNDPDVKTALSGKKCTIAHLSGKQFDTYLYNASESGAQPEGYALLVAAAEGRPTRNDDVRDLVANIHSELQQYLTTFIELPKPKDSSAPGRRVVDSLENFELITPDSGSTPHYKVRPRNKATLHHEAPTKPDADPVHYLDAAQRKALQEKIEAISLPMRVFLGNVQVPWR